MPTGYTADVESGKVTDFRTFALGCARAFGACIMQREDAMDALPEYRKVEPYRAEQILKAEVEQDRYARMSLAEADALAEAEYRDATARHERSVVRNTEEMARYNAMLAEVVGWTPPTPAHEGLKKFMLAQLHESMQYHEYRVPAPARQSAKTWLEAKRARATKDVAYYTQSKRDEDERVRSANEWIRVLYESLNTQEVG